MAKFFVANLICVVILAGISHGANPFKKMFGNVKQNNPSNEITGLLSFRGLKLYLNSKGNHNIVPTF